jgi:hypothetical protein
MKLRRRTRSFWRQTGISISQRINFTANPASITHNDDIPAAADSSAHFFSS